MVNVAPVLETERLKLIPLNSTMHLSEKDQLGISPLEI